MTVTPIITPHARDRCAEMGVSTKVAKRIVREPSTTRPDPQGHPRRRFVWSAVEPDYAVVVDVESAPPVVCTVLYYTSEPFTRPERKAS